MSRLIQRLLFGCAGLILATACTTSYGPDNPPHEEDIGTPVCEEGSVGPGCAEVNPDCTDPSSYCAEPL